MKIQILSAPEPEETTVRLAEFTRRSPMPVGNGHSAFVDHLGDRTGLIRSLGQGYTLVCESGGRITGTLDAASVRVLDRDGGEYHAGYIMDVMIAPEARKGLATGRLIQRALSLAPNGCTAAIAPVMQANPIKPSSYSGRAGIPAMREAGRFMNVRVPLAHATASPAVAPGFIASPEAGEAAFRRLALGHHAIFSGDPIARSVEPPVWLVHPGGGACGRLEDRRRVRRIIDDAGEELRPGYLSCFLFNDARAGLELLRTAAAWAVGARFHALRFCIGPLRYAGLEGIAPRGLMEAAAGLIYATETANAPWCVNAIEM